MFPSVVSSCPRKRARASTGSSAGSVAIWPPASPIAFSTVSSGWKGYEPGVRTSPTTKIGRSFPLVYLVFNTIVNLTTQDEQVACFENAAAHLAPRGAFVIEVGIPSLRLLRQGETVVVSQYREGYHCVDEFDVANQGLISHHFTAEGDGFRERSIPFRYVWPSELDLMARIAGLRLRERWSGWAREPFTSESTWHISVWEKPVSG